MIQSGKRNQLSRKVHSTMVQYLRLVGLALMLSAGFGSAISADNQSSTSVNFNRLVGVDLFGDDLTSMGIKGISLAECEAICSEDSSCKAYSFIEDKKWCFPKSGSGNKKDNAAVISGIKEVIVVIDEETASTQVDLQVELIQSIPKQNRDAVKRILSYYSNQCSGYQDVGENGKLKIEKDNLKHIKLLQGNTELTVLDASFECPGAGYIWSGSAGSPTYLVIDGSIYEIAGGSPYPFDISKDRTVLINWHGGNDCQAMDGQSYPNSGACFSSMYWSDDDKTFIVFDGSIKVKKRRF